MVVPRRRARDGAERCLTGRYLLVISGVSSHEWCCFSWALISLFVLQVTNQVTRDSGSGPLKPALGRSWSFVPSTRVLLETKEAAWEKATVQRIASLAKSPRQVRRPGAVLWWRRTIRDL